MAQKENKGFLLRLDRQTMELVEKWASQEFRSVNGQLQWIIADSLRRYGRLKIENNDSPTITDSIQNEN